MRKPIGRPIIEDIVGTHIYKLPYKGPSERFALPIEDMFTLLMGSQAIGGVSKLGCRDLGDVLEKLNFQLGTTLAKYYNETDDALISKVKQSIDKLIGFDSSLFDARCADDDLDPNQCHVLMPLHVSDLLRDTLDEQQSLYGIDGHIYLSRDYLGEYAVSYANSFAVSHWN